MRVVTIGGGHGQAALLAALLRLECEITAVVSIADDGGCSGKLRREFGMAPPGDMRRCLSTLAADRVLAECFESRLVEPGLEGRSAGNLVLAEAYRTLGGLQAAIDWAADLLGCRGRVVPAAEGPGVLTVYDQVTGRVDGETAVAQRSRTPLVVTVEGPWQANPAAIAAIEDADWILIGPGSFVTSILATLGTADLASALPRARGRCVLLANLVAEGDQLRDFGVADYVRLLDDHIVIHSQGHRIPIAVLVNQERGHGRDQLTGGTTLLASPLAAPGTHTHDPHLVATALTEHLGLRPRQDGETGAPPDRRPRADTIFAESLARARAHLESPTRDQLHP